MRFPAAMWLFCLASTALLHAQSSLQRHEDLDYQRRVVQLEEDLSKRSEDLKNLRTEFDALKQELKGIRDQAKSADDLSKSNDDRISQITWFGRLILGGLAFLIGVLVTQLVSRFMSDRTPRVVQP